MNDKYQKLYQYLSSNGMTDLDMNSFYNEYSSNPNKVKKLYSYLSQNGMTDLDENSFSNEYFAVKKKEVSQSTPKQKVTSSVTSKTAQKQPSVSSAETYNWNGQNYIYRNNRWEETALFEGDKSIPQSQKSAFKKVTDRNKIKQLNYQFKKDVSLDPIEQVYSNYDEEKKDNEYRISNGTWQRKVPGAKSWTTITNEGSVNALNRRYNQNVKFTPDLQVKKSEPKLKFADVNTSLVAKTEEDAVGTLSKKYGKYGFTFEQSGFGTDYVKVYNKDKSKEITIGFDEKNPEEALKLKNFLEQNASSTISSNYEKIQSKKESEKDYYKYISSDEYKNDFKALSYDEMEKEIDNRLNFISRTGEPEKRKERIDALYNSNAYKIFKEKKKEEFGARDQRIDLLYTELQTAKTSGNKNAIKDINSKITAYLNQDVIQDQVMNYSMQLNDLNNAAKKLADDQKKYLQSVEDFNKRSQSGQMTQEEFDQNKKMLDDQAEALSTRADFLMSSGKSIQTNQKKLNVVAGKYISEKEKAGGFFGGTINSFLGGVGKLIEEFNPKKYIVELDAYKDTKYKYLSPEEKQFYKDKGYSEEQIKNKLTNDKLKEIKKGIKGALIEGIGSDLTTEEYMKSKDRGFFEKAIYGVAESVPAMLMGVGGSNAAFIGLSKQAYSSIEDEMINDPDFETTSAQERAVVAVPYATLMGVLENYGLKNVVKGKSFAGGIVKNILASSISKIPKGASREALQSIMDKEVKSLIAKGSLRIVNGAIAEFETGATQSLVLDIGLKSLYNKLAQSGMTEEEVSKLSGGEMFTTPDTLGEVASTVLEDGLAEAVGGATIGTFTTVASGLMNGNISLYNEEDLEYLKEISQDSNFKKIIVANLKTEMLKGNLTKSEAQERLSAMNELASVVESIPDGLTKEDQIEAVNMLSEKNRLTKEIQGKDPALVTAQTERINEINDELKTISKNAVQVETTDEVSVQPEAIVSREVEEGKPQAESEDVTEKSQAVKEVIDRTRSRLLSIENKSEFDKNPIENAKKDIEERINYIESLEEMDSVDERILKELKDDYNILNTQAAAETKVTPVATEVKTESPVSESEKSDIENIELKNNTFTAVYSPTNESRIFGSYTEAAQWITNKYKTEETVVFEPITKQEQKQNLVTEENVEQLRSQQTTPRAQKIFTAAKLAMKALPGVKIYVHNTTNEFDQAIGQKSVEGAKGAYLDGEVHINLENGADVVTMLHESLHHGLVIKGIQSGAMLDLAKGLKSVISDKGLKQRLENFISNYDATEQAEEYVAELGAIMAEAQQELSTTKFQQFKNLINKIAQKLGLPIVFTASANANNAVDFMNSLTKSIRTGQEVKAEEVKKTGKVKFQADFSDPLSKLTFVYDKNGEKFDQLKKEGFITDDKNLSDFAGKFIFLHQPDAAFSGMIYKDGELLVEGKGGVFYPIKFHDDGYFWASTATTAEKMAKDLNKVFDQNNGTIYMALTSAPYDKLMSSTTMSNAILDFFSSKAFDNNFKISPAQLKVALRKAANDIKIKKTKDPKTGKIKEKKVGLDLKIKAETSLDDIQSQIRTALNPDEKSFADRKNFAEELIKLMADKIKNDPKATEQFGKLFSEGIQNKYFKGISKTGKLSISAANMTQAISEMFTEPLLKEDIDREKGGQVYAIVELNGKVEPVDSDKHESYPKAIQSENKNNKVKIHILQDRQNWADSFIDPETGETISEDRQKKLFPTSGVSVMGLQLKGPSKVKFQKANTQQEAIQKAKEKYTLSVEQRGNPHQQGVDAALNDLRKSDWYNAADDTQRENAERELKEFFGERLKKAPSVAKITGKPKAKKVAIKDEYKAMITQIKMEAKAAREAKADLNAKRKMLAAAISGMVKTGKIKASQAAVLVKRVSSLNLDNPVMVERFTNYAQRVFERADYQQRLDDAFAIRKSIRKLLKTDNQAEVSGMAKAFTKIDPSLVEDIDAYMEMADKVKNAVKPSRVKGLDVVMKESANIAEISEYTNEEIARQEDIQKKELLATYDFLEGEMSLKEMQDVINALKDPTSQMDTAEKEKYVKDYLNGRFGIMSSILDSMFKTGIDPMTGEEITFDEKQKELIKRALNIDLNEMSVRDAIKIVESLENFITNQITSGLEAAVSSYEGAMNVKSLVNRGRKAKSLRLFFSKYVGKIYSEQLFSLPMLMEKMFGGVTNSIDVMNKMGLIKLVNGVNKANRQHNEIIDEYSKQPFYATKNALGRYVMNKGFMDAENVYERGMLAFLKRNLVGNPTEMKAEFERRVRMIQESINKLIEDGDPKEQKMGELYQKIYDKLGVSEMDMDVINANASKNNLDAVNWWVNQWSQHYSDLSDISLSVYNTQLGSDLNYTPDKYKRLSSENQSLDEGAVERNGAFAITIDYTDKNKTGVLMETTRPNVMPDGRYISLDFDTNNSKALKSALVDINTAAAIRQVDGFINSKSFKKLIPESEDRTIMTKRINTYIRRAKGKSIVASDTMQYLNKLTNYITSLGVGKALGGINQAVSQTIPVVVNTVVNAGRFDIAGADFNAWLNKSGLPISNRGLESQSTVESIDRKIDMKGTGTQEALKAIADLNQWYLKQFLVKPDVFVARSSFKSYYLQNLKRRGISTDIDWTTHEMDMEAAEYAQAMIDRQQNISDSMLAGEFLSSDDPMKQIARKVVLPFASFILNQKARMYNDLNTLFSKTSTNEDRVIASKSLAGLAAELATYQMIGFGIRRLYDIIAASLLGDEDDEETKKKKLINATKYPVKSIVNDIVSPLPMTDGITTWGLNQALAQYPWMSDKEIKDAVESRNKVLELKGEPNMTEAEEKEFIAKIKEEATYQVFDDDFDRSYGMIGIVGSTYQELGEISKLSTTGEFTDEYQGRETTKKLLDSDREKVKYAVPFMIAYSTGLLPKDVGAISRNYVNRIKKKAITEKQYERYDAVQKDLGRNLKSWEIDIVKSKKESETAISEIEFIERNGGLTERQGREYLKLMKAIGEPTISDIVKIKEGKTADQILK